MSEIGKSRKLQKEEIKKNQKLEQVEKVGCQK